MGIRERKRKKSNFLKELRILVKRNRIILILLLIAFGVIVKNSDLPVLLCLPKGLKSFFLKPQSKTNKAIVFSFFENLSLAYIASSIFYFIVDYFPKRKKERKAMFSIQRELIRVYGNLSYIIRMFLFEIGRNDEPQMVIKKKIDVSNICQIVLDNKNKHARIYHLIDGADGGRSSSYNINRDSIKYIQEIEESIDKIYNRPFASDLEGSLCLILDGINNSKFLRMIKSYIQMGIIDLPGTNRIFLNLSQAFLELMDLYVRLERYEFKKVDYRFSTITEVEWRRETEELALMLGRDLFINAPMNKVRGMVNGLLGITLNDEMFDKISSVLCELLVAYDAVPQRKDLLVLGKQIAGYLKSYEGTKEQTAIAAINYLQVIKRMGTATKKDIREIRWILAKDENLPDYIVLGALILVKNYEEAKKVLNKLDDDMRQLFISFPVYSLWSAPPIPPAIEPIDFRNLNRT